MHVLTQSGVGLLIPCLWFKEPQQQGRGFAVLHWVQFTCPLTSFAGPGEQATSPTVQVSKASVWEAICNGVSPHVLSNFLVLGLPGGVMMAADACSFDVTTVMASILGESLQQRMVLITWH